MSKLAQSKINHVAFILDGSGSMRVHREALIKAFDNQVAFLAQLSRDTDQETRVTVYVFDDSVECVIFDKDVLRLPSIRDLYWVQGMTALRDAVVKGQNELGQTCQLYGDHSFLTFVLTDGLDNVSDFRIPEFRDFLSSQKENRTIGILVPDVNGKLAAEAAGFTTGNISIWNTGSATGVEEALTEVQAATASYFAGRAAGQTGTRTLFSTDASAVNATTIKQAGLKPLAKGTYNLVPVTRPRADRNQGVLNKDKHRVWEISEFVRHATGTFRVGSAFYRLDKKERIQGNKLLAVVEKNTGKVFFGDGVRAMIGLPDGDKSVAPDHNDEYDIYVQSSSTNRHLFSGTKVLILDGTHV